MTRIQKKKTTRWQFWAAGLYLSMLSVPSIPLDSLSYGWMSLATFLFLWGYLRSEDF